MLRQYILRSQGVRNVPSKEQVRNMHKDMQSWRRVAQTLGVSKSTAWQYANTDWEPRSRMLRKKLGLGVPSEIIYIRQVRSEDGTFS